jgi:hypothetical protein
MHRRRLNCSSHEDMAIKTYAALKWPTLSFTSGRGPLDEPCYFVEFVNELNRRPIIVASYHEAKYTI